MMKKLLALLLCLMLLPLLPAVAEDEEMLVVYANVPADWTWPCVWAWSSDGTNALLLGPASRWSLTPPTKAGITFTSLLAWKA